MEILGRLWENFLDWVVQSGPKILIISVVAFVAYFVIRRIIKRLVVVLVVKQDDDDLGEKQREQTLIQIFTMAAKILIGLIALLMIVSEFGIRIAPLLASAGVVGLALGFGGQYLIKDLISGLFIIMENQYRINDYVEIADKEGKVERITLRMTTLRDLDGDTHHVPHGEITTVTNLSKSFSRINLDIGIGYGSDLEQVESVVNEVGRQFAADEAWSDQLLSEPKFLRVNELGDSAVVIKVVGETKPSEQWAVTGELRKRLYNAFNENNIEIPFPQRVMHLVKDDSKKENSEQKQIKKQYNEDHI